MTESRTKDGIIIIGPPGSGKTSHTTRLNNEFGMHVLRGRNICPDKVSLFEAQRALIPEEIFIPPLKRALKSLSERGYDHQVVFDNIPRSAMQADVLIKWAAESRVNLTTVALELEEQEVRARFTERKVCPTCNESYHFELKPPKVEGQCDTHGTPLIKRPGDDLENVDHAFSRHQKLVAELKRPLGEVGSFHTVSATGRVDIVFDRIATMLNLEHHNSAA